MHSHSVIIKARRTPIGSFQGELSSFSAEKSAKTIEKTLMSAVSNFMQKSDNEKPSSQDLFVKEVFVNGGPVMKRFRAASMGRASRLRRPTSHLTVIITSKKQ